MIPITVPSPAPADPGVAPAPLRPHLLDLIAQAGGWLAHRPWLLGAAGALIAVLSIAATAVGAAGRRARHRRLALHAYEVLVTPPSEVDPAGAATWWANLFELLTPSRWWRRLMSGVPHVAVEYRWAGRQLSLVVWLPGTVPAGPVAGAVRAAWPGATASVAAATAPLPVPAHGNQVRDAGGALAPAMPAWYPLQVDHDTDPTRALVAAGSGLGDGECA